MLGEELWTVILIILGTKALNQVMNHHSKILILPLNHEGTIATILLLVKYHHSSKEKLCLRVSVGTSYWKPKWDTIRDDPKSNCFVKWLEKELGNDLIFLPSGSTKYFFYQSYVSAGHWSNIEEKCAKMQKSIKCSALTYCKCDESLCLNKEMFFRFPYSCSVLRYENFLSNFFLRWNKVVYINNYFGANDSLRVYTVAFICLYPRCLYLN